MAGFDGLNVLITGAGTGLGAATAIGIARQGGRVIINYAASQREAEATADVCRTAGGEARVAQGNVADDADCRRIATRPPGVERALVANLAHLPRWSACAPGGEERRQISRLRLEFLVPFRQHNPRLLASRPQVHRRPQP